MAYQVGNVCYDTAEAAASAAASVVGGSIHQAGQALYAVEVSATSATAITYTLHGISQPGTAMVSVPYQAQPCGLLDASDGVALGWQVASVWVIAWATMLIARAMWATLGADDDKP